MLDLVEIHCNNGVRSELQQCGNQSLLLVEARRGTESAGVRR